MAKKRLRDIIILLPGITGSVLQKNGKDLWAISGQAAWRALQSLGSSLQDLRLEGDDPEIEDLGDGIVATRVMPDVHIVPGLTKIDGYSKTVRMVTDNFQVIHGSLNDDRPANFFEFPYDWRRDNRVAARRLKVLIDRQLPVWRKFSGAQDAKVILIAHSMGGLVSRYYLELLEGWRDCKALITFGTPYRGSLNALEFLANGYKKLFVDLTEVMRSFTSMYQLLPIYEAVRVGNVYRRVSETDGIKGVNRAHAAQALEFHREIEKAVETNGRHVEYLQQGYRILPIVGTRQPTFQSAEFKDHSLKVSRKLPDGIDELLGEGDGTVPRLSAIPIELSEEYRDTFVPERHSSLQSNDHVLADVLGRLQQMQIKGLKEVRGPEVSTEAETRPALSVELDDLYSTEEPVEIHAHLINMTELTGSLQARLEPLVGDRENTVERTFTDDGDGLVLKLEKLPPGVYRVTVKTSIGAKVPLQEYMMCSKWTAKFFYSLGNANRK